MGLSIVRRLVELMGGETGVESVEGAGSLFWFTAHFAQVSDSLQPLYPAPASLKGQRVLVVDDNTTNRKILMGQLLLCGVDPHDHAARLACTAGSGRLQYLAGRGQSSKPKGGHTPVGKTGLSRARRC